MSASFVSRLPPAHPPQSRTSHTGHKTTTGTMSVPNTRTEDGSGPACCCFWMRSGWAGRYPWLATAVRRASSFCCRVEFLSKNTCQRTPHGPESGFLFSISTHNDATQEGVFSVAGMGSGARRGAEKTLHMVSDSTVAERMVSVRPCL
eukprot:1090590-Rhodomonas_salina.1